MRYLEEIKDKYEQQGYLLLQNFFDEHSLLKLENILLKFHKIWLAENEVYYKNGLINSHSLTSGNTLGQKEKLELFNFISSDNLYQIMTRIFPSEAVFLNTQLFFDPFNQNQHNYWHRDIQYTGLSIDDQKKAIKKQNVIHFRIPLKAEKGIELIPGSHNNWDLAEEYDVRMSLNGKNPSDPLSRGKQISLNRSDLLVFSANLIHRGIYGNDRLSFDVLFVDKNPEMTRFIDPVNHPSAKLLEQLDKKDLFL